MGDLHQFKRSKDRITEILAGLVHKNTKDEKTNLMIEDLQKSIEILDVKIEEWYYGSPNHQA
jgi:hypothetical protein